MEAETVVRKTEKGERAIEHRTEELDRHLRYVLILVDGKSTVAELRDKGSGLPDFDESLRQLSELGFIASEHAQAGPSAAGASVDYAAIKEQLVDVAEELLGADAEKVVKKLRAAPESREGILEATRACKKMVKLIIDEQKAEKLMLRCSEILDSV